MSLPQDPWAQPQQSVASNRSAIVGEKGNSTLAHRQRPLWTTLCLIGSRFDRVYTKVIVWEEGSKKWVCVLAFGLFRQNFYFVFREIIIVIKVIQKTFTNAEYATALWGEK